MMTADHELYAVHPEPVWRDRADFIINAQLETTDLPYRYEQLWARELGDREYEICCIPFFLFGVALGDIVGTVPKARHSYVLDRVIKPSGRSVFRIWFGDAEADQQAVAERLSSVGALLERSSSSLVSVDAKDEAGAQEVRDLLAEWQRGGALLYEVGTFR